MSTERLIIRKMMIRGKEGYNTFRIHFAEAQKAVVNRGRRTQVGRLDQQSRRWNSSNFIGIETLVCFRQHQQSPPRMNRSENPVLRLMQECFVTEDGAKLLGPIIAGDSSREWEQSLSVTSGQNRSPAVAARIASVESCWIYFGLHFTLGLSLLVPSRTLTEMLFERG